MCLLVLLSALVSSGSAWAKEYAVLSNAELTEFFSTLWTAAGDNVRGNVSLTTYVPDGSLYLTYTSADQTDGKHFTLQGKWYIDNATVCTTNDFIAPQERCYEYLGNGTSRYLLRTKGAKKSQGFFFRVEAFSPE